MQLYYIKAPLTGLQHCIGVSPYHILLGTHEQKDPNQLILKNRALQTVCSLKVPGPISEVKFMPRYPEIAVALSGSVSHSPLRLYNVTQSQLRLHMVLPALCRVSAFALSEELPQLLFGTCDGQLELFDLARNYVSHRFYSDVYYITSLCTWRENTYFLGSGCSLTVYDRRTNAVSKPLRTGAAEIMQMYLGYYGGTYVVYLLEKQAQCVQVIDITGKLIAQLNNDVAKPIKRFSTNNVLLAMIDDSHVAVFEIATQTLFFRYDKPSEAVICDQTRLWIVSSKLCEAIPLTTNNVTAEWGSAQY